MTLWVFNLFITIVIIMIISILLDIAGWHFLHCVSKKRYVATLLGKFEIQIFCRYSADMEENANKLHFKCTDFNSYTRV